MHERPRSFPPAHEQNVGHDATPTFTQQGAERVTRA